ncbi:hypothetical protein DXG03_003938 [Asterophora parasitica]|uniref:Uncharacterized protein n=1 Tax=Asterophora parasitica TaxID=117018 RepID=A0A9P7G137_9AGAR|nr:hypothetical protein DXG03_003938 [Asterophora parasitica]
MRLLSIVSIAFVLSSTAYAASVGGPLKARARENGDLITSGSYAGSSVECPSKAPRDMECAQEVDKGSYYRLACKDPTSPKCTYESDECYACPSLKSDFVNINNENDNLECGYSVKGNVVNTCSYNVIVSSVLRYLIALTQFTQQAANGQLAGKTSDSPACPGSTTKASKCVQVKEANEAATKKAAYLKKEFADNGLLAHPCDEYLREKYTRRGSVIIRQYLFIACVVPELLKTFKPIAGTEFAADLEKMRKTESYGYYHVTTEAENAAAEKKKKEEVGECMKKIYREEEEDAAPDYEPNEEELEAVAKYGNPCDPFNRYW